MTEHVDFKSREAAASLKPGTVVRTRSGEQFTITRRDPGWCKAAYAWYRTEQGIAVFACFGDKRHHSHRRDIAAIISTPDDAECPWKPGEEYRTRDGRRARIYCTDAGGAHPVHGAYWSEYYNGWICCTWTPNGARTGGGSEHEDDLLPPEKPHEWDDSDIASVMVFSHTQRVNIELSRECSEVGLSRADLVHMLAMLDEEGEA